MIVNLPLFSLGVIWKNEDCVVPVSIVTQADVDVSGLASTGVTVVYNREGDSGNQTFAPSAAQWKEMGRGLYNLTIPAALLNQEGVFGYVVDSVASGNKTFRSAGRIEQRPEARIFNAYASGFNTANTMGAYMNRAGNNVEVFSGAAYDAGAQTLTFMVFGQQNGSLCTGATAARVTVKDDTDATVYDGSSGSPNADGMFKLVGTTIVLTSKKAYKVRARVTVGGVEYSSGESLQSFN